MCYAPYSVHVRARHRRCRSLSVRCVSRDSPVPHLSTYSSSRSTDETGTGEYGTQWTSHVLEIAFALFFGRFYCLKFSVDVLNGVFQDFTPLIDVVQPIRDAHVTREESRRRMRASVVRFGHLLVVLVPPGLIVGLVDQLSTVLSYLMRHVPTAFGVVRDRVATTDRLKNEEPADGRELTCG